jgi:glycerol-3-phosphate O-acyltransferase
MLTYGAGISYDAPPDMSAHVKELMGTRKVKESLGALLSAAPSNLSRSHGRVEVTIGTPISLKACATAVASAAASAAASAGARKADAIEARADAVEARADAIEARARARAVVSSVADAVVKQLIRHLAIPPSALTAVEQVL